MAETSPASLSSRLTDYAQRGTVRLAARDADGWIDRSQLISGVETFTLEPAGEPTRRYRLSLVDGSPGLELQETVRSVYRVVEVNDGQPLQRENVELVVDLPGDALEEAAAAVDGSETLPASVLGRVDDVERENFQSVTANRVAGLEAEKGQLVRFLETGNFEWGLSEPTGILLEGQPGTGKTELVMEICQERYGALPITISGPEILSKWVGESERLLREKFEEALETGHRILYIDELDAIAQTRAESSQDYTAQLVSQLLVLLDGIEAKRESDGERPLRVIASTNIAQVIDPALLRPGRLGNRPIQFGYPTERARAAIIHHYLENIYASSGGRLGESLERCVTSMDGIETLRRLARRMEGFTGADIEDVIQESVSLARADDRDVLTEAFLVEVLEDEFTASSKYRIREYSPQEVGGAEAGSMGDGRVFELEPAEASIEAAEDLARRYFASLADDAPDDQRFVFRAVAPRHLLGADVDRTREETAAAFQHIETEQLCLYIEGMNTLARARDLSPLVRSVIEVMNEQLIQWDEANVLIVEGGEETSSLLCIE